MATNKTDRSIALLCRAQGTDSPREAIAQRVEALLDKAERIGGLAQLPVDVEFVASVAGITSVLDVSGLVTAAQVRPLSSIDRRLVVERRAEDPLVRRRFSVGHEIGHTLFPDFWNDPVACRPPSDETLVGARAEEVEALCELAGALILLPTRLVTGTINHIRPSMADVVHVAELAQASLIASGRRVVDLAESPAAFLVLSSRLSKTERQRQAELIDQTVLPGFDAAVVVEPKFRIDYSHSSEGMPYLPRHKSLPSAIFEAARETGLVEMTCETLELHSRPIELDLTAIYAPLNIGVERRERYLAVATIRAQSPD